MSITLILSVSVLLLIGGIGFANACFVGEESIENSGSEYYKDRYDSSNWILPVNIYHPDNYDECVMLGWC